MASIGGPNKITDGLILAMDVSSERSYPLTFGTTWHDLSGNDLDGTLQNGDMARVVPGEVRLNKTSDRINFGHDTLLEPTSITVSAWVNLLDISDRHILITKWYGFSFEIGSNACPYFRLNGPGDQHSSQAIVWGDWHHIVGTFDSSTLKHDVYVDGVNKGTSVKSSQISYGQGTFNIPYTGNPGYAKGKMASLYIHNRALTAAEVLQNYNASKNRFT